jgi:hypothetical protein
LTILLYGICSLCIRFESINFQNQNFRIVSSVLATIGSSVKHVIFKGVDIKSNHLFALLSLFPNVEKLDMMGVEIEDLAESLPELPHKFKKLKSLKITDEARDGHNQTDYYSHVFKDVTTLEEMELSLNFNLIPRQPKLKKLKLIIDKDNFTAFQHNDEVQVTDLSVDFGFYMTGRPFHLDSFIKTQTKIEKISIVITCNLPRKEEYLSEFFRHVLSLESLHTFCTSCLCTIHCLPVGQIRNRSHHVYE